MIAFTMKPHVCHFRIAVRRCDFLLLPPSAFFRLFRMQIWRMAPVLSWYLMSQVLFSSFQFKFAQYYTWVIKFIKTYRIAEHILHSILCIALEEDTFWTFLLTFLLSYPVKILNCTKLASVNLLKGGHKYNSWDKQNAVPNKRTTECCELSAGLVINELMNLRDRPSLTRLRKHPHAVHRCFFTRIRSSLIPMKLKKVGVIKASFASQNEIHSSD